jgi:hypothetical protein
MCITRVSLQGRTPLNLAKGLRRTRSAHAAHLPATTTYGSYGKNYLIMKSTSKKRKIGGVGKAASSGKRMKAKQVRTMLLPFVPRTSQNVPD